MIFWCGHSCSFSKYIFNHVFLLSIYHSVSRTFIGISCILLEYSVYSTVFLHKQNAKPNLLRKNFRSMIDSISYRNALCLWRISSLPSWSTMTRSKNIEKSRERNFKRKKVWETLHHKNVLRDFDIFMFPSSLIFLCWNRILEKKECLLKTIEDFLLLFVSHINERLENWKSRNIVFTFL